MKIKRFLATHENSYAMIIRDSNHVTCLLLNVNDEFIKAMTDAINNGKSWGSKAFLTSVQEVMARPNSGLTIQTMYMNMSKAIILYTVQGITKVSAATSEDK